MDALAGLGALPEWLGLDLVLALGLAGLACVLCGMWLRRMSWCARAQTRRHAEATTVLVEGEHLSVEDFSTALAVDRAPLAANPPEGEVVLLSADIAQRPTDCIEIEVQLGETPAQVRALSREFERARRRPAVTARPAPLPAPTSARSRSRPGQCLGAPPQAARWPRPGSQAGARAPRSACAGTCCPPARPGVTGGRAMLLCLDR